MQGIELKPDNTAKSIGYLGEVDQLTCIRSFTKSGPRLRATDWCSGLIREGVVSPILSIDTLKVTGLIDSSPVLDDYGVILRYKRAE